MRIAIIGLPGSGKSYLARKISKLYKIKHIELDSEVFDFFPGKIRKEKSKVEIDKKLEHFLKQKDWIIEGVFDFKKVLENADVILYLKPNLAKIIYFQWKRRFSDKKRRGQYRFRDTLRLSFTTVQLLFINKGSQITTNLRYISRKEMETRLNMVNVYTISNTKDGLKTIKDFLI